MDVVWDQDVRTALAAIIGISNVTSIDEPGLDNVVKKHVQLAIRYADELGKARAVIERKPPVSNYRPGRVR